MSKQRNINFLPGFIVKVVLPSCLAVALYVISIFFIFIPAFERRIIEDKKETIRELTETAWCVLEESQANVESGKRTLKEAQANAIARIRDLRYGKEAKDYFWLTDMKPTMIMHPYKPELDGKDLGDYTGYNDKRVFVEFAEIVKKRGAGYSKYLWQWKDRPDSVMHKLSYVKGFKPWGWIVGTGIYLDDVKREIDAMESRLAHISLGIIAVMAASLGLVAIRGYRVEAARVEAERRLAESHDKYKALAAAATEGLVMVLGNDYAYVNEAARRLLGCDDERAFADLDVFGLRHLGEENDDEARKYVEAVMAGEGVPPQYETNLRRRDGDRVPVALAGSKIALGEKTGFIVIVKDLSGAEEREKRRIEEEREDLIVELQTALLFMNQPISQFLRPLTSCAMNDPVREVAKVMNRKNVDAVLVTTDSGAFVGVVTTSDVTRRAVAGERSDAGPVFEIMTSPLVTIDSEALIFEALSLMNERGVGHLAVTDASGKVVSVVSIDELVRVQRYSSATLIQEIEKAIDVDAMTECHRRTPRLIKALIDSGAKAKNVTRILSAVSDLILRKLVGFAIDELGKPPVKFSFLLLGSEGRGEETLITDQDNAIVYEDPPSEAVRLEAEAYFEKLGNKVCDWLDALGYSYCKGDVMAKNPLWRQPLTQWKNHFTGWIVEAEPKALLKFNIFFDFRSGFGSDDLVEELRRHIDALLDENKAFFPLLASNCLLYKPPLNLFGGIAVETNGEHSNTFDIKEASKPVVNFARIHALERHVREANTLARLDRLRERDALSEESHRDLVDVYDYLTQMRFRHQSKAISEGRPPNNHVNLDELTDLERDTLKKVFGKINLFQSKLSFHYKGTSQ